MTRITRSRSARAACVLALAFSLGVGAGLTAGARGSDGETAQSGEWVSPEFDSPSVTGLPVQRATQILNSKGYDVMVVGSGEVRLQQLGFEGALLRIEGEDDGPRRYCGAAAARCVLVGAAAAR